MYYGDLDLGAKQHKKPAHKASGNDTEYRTSFRKISAVKLAVTLRSFKEWPFLRCFAGCIYVALGEMTL